MKKFYKYTEWQSPSGRWYVAHTDNMQLSRWWLAPRALNIPVDEYLKILVEKYHADHISFYDYSDARNSFLSFSFEHYEDAHKYLLDMNKIFRQLNWVH